MPRVDTGLSLFFSDHWIPGSAAMRIITEEESHFAAGEGGVAFTR